jgi:hypothetical protein
VSVLWYLTAWAAALVFWMAPLHGAVEQSNRVPDASFEAPTPSWFSEAGHGSYFAGKGQVPDAADGSTVLVIQGWH